MRLAVLSFMARGKITGLGVYARMCIDFLDERCKYIRVGDFDDCSADIKPSRSIAFSGVVAALYRFIWLNFLKFNDDTLLYSPTHHGSIRVRRQIITIHDLIALRHPWQHPLQWLYFRFYVPFLLSRCVAVFTVSHVSKSDIVKYFGFPVARIHVISNGIAVNSTKRVFDDGLSDSYLLVVGASYSHKNIHELIINSDLWAGCYRLKIVSSKGSYKKYLYSLCQKFHIQDRVEFLGYVSDEELGTLYRNAAALIYPSLWEGFGIPPLEALVRGTPVVASDIPVLREVLEDSAIYVTLGSRSSWEDAFTSLKNVQFLATKLALVDSVVGKYSFENVKHELNAALDIYL